jgi:hypothetical protein
MKPVLYVTFPEGVRVGERERKWSGVTVRAECNYTATLLEIGYLGNSQEDGLTQLITLTHILQRKMTATATFTGFCRRHDNHASGFMFTTIRNHPSSGTWQGLIWH